MTEPHELLLKLALCLLAAGALFGTFRAGERRRAGAALTILAIAGLVAALTNFFTFHSGRLIHAQEMFHYGLGSKYFPELGYDGLYEASVAAQVDSFPNLPAPGIIRDLKTNSIVPAVVAIERRAETIARFRPARWKRFVADHAATVEDVAVTFPDTRIDHGYNPSPAWTFVGRLFSAWPPLNETTLSLLVFLDWLLIGGALVAVHRTYGARAAATFAILLGLGYPWRYVWVGGSILRFDWLAAVIIGVCLLERSRFFLAGALFAYAAAVRIFPLLLLAGIAVVAVRDLLSRRDPRWIARFAAGFAACMAACFLAGALTGRGFGAWGEFARNIQKHNDTWSLNTVGLELAVLYPPTVMLGRPDRWSLALDERYEAFLDSAPGGGYMVRVPGLGMEARTETFESARIAAEEAIARNTVRWQGEMTRVQSARRPIFVAAAAVFLAALALAAWRGSVARAAVLGIVAIFALLHVSSYYGAVATLMALRRGMVGIRGSVGLLLLNAATFAIATISSSLQVIYLAFTWGMGVLLVVWLFPDVLATLRGETPENVGIAGTHSKPAPARTPGAKSPSRTSPAGRRKR